MPFFSSARSQTDNNGNDAAAGGEGSNTAAAAAAAAANDGNDNNIKNNNNNNNKKSSNNSIGSRIRTFLLLHVLTALLPPTESKDELKSTEYYKVLGLKKNATAEQIRKAYKQKSLALHPDKVRQRQARARRQQRNSNTNNNNNNNYNNTQDNAEENNTMDLTEEQAAELFLKVQEAHAVLSDAHNRRVYHEFGCSPARYKFVHDNADEGNGSAALHHPMMLYENLTKASFVNKTRLVSVFTIFILLALLQPILICAKINQELSSSSFNNNNNNNGGGLQNTPWSVILIPFWIVYGCMFMSIQVLLVCCWVRNNWQVRWFALQHFMFLIGMILLVQVWDGHRGGSGGGASSTSSTTNWHAISTPFYLVIFCRVAGMAATARDLMDVVHTRMASLEHLQQTEPRPVRQQQRRNTDNNNSNHSGGGNETDNDDDDDDDFLTEEEWIAQLSEKYVIVTPDPQIVEAHIVLWHEEHDENINNNNEEPASSPTSRCDVEIPEEDMESIRIASSLEYQSAMEQVQALQRSAGNFFVYGIVMVALIAAKLTPSQLATKSSWWAIFTPIWIYLFLEMMKAISLCCCSGLAAGNNEGVIILASAAAAASSSAAAGTEAGATGESQNQNGNDLENQQGGVTAAAAAATSTPSANNNKSDQSQDEHGKNREQEERVASSVKWANAEGSMDLPSIRTATTTTTPNDQDDNASLTPSDEGCFGQKRSADPPGMKAEEVVQQQQKDPPGVTAAATALPNGQEEGGDSSGVVSGNPPSHPEQEQQQRGDGGVHGVDSTDDDEEMPHFDEETYHRWQQAHAAAESSAMEAQAKGQWQCCVAIFQLIILCLVVGKLQDESSGQTGYNAFWILFPIFFLAGILVCCCSCLIYTSGSVDDLVNKAKGDDDADNNDGNDTESNANQTGNSNNNNNDVSNDSSPTIPLAAPQPTTQATTTTQGELVASKHQPTAAGAAAEATVQSPTETTVAETVGVGGGDIENRMDDLD